MDIEGKRVPFGTDLLFVCEEVPELVAAAEICEDLWVTLPPSVLHAQAGANLIVNLSASDEMVGKDSLPQKPCYRTVCETCLWICLRNTPVKVSLRRIWYLADRI